jgi:hypothetical protein
MAGHIREGSCCKKGEWVMSAASLNIRGIMPVHALQPLTVLMRQDGTLMIRSTSSTMDVA